MGPVADHLFVVLVLGGLAFWVFWGWKSWIPVRGATSRTGWLSVVAFGLASGSALLQIGSGTYAQFVSVPFEDPKLMRIFAIGFWLATLGFVCGLLGSFWKGTLRFKAPCLSGFLLLLWILQAMAE